jgi:hypothetical protein
MTNETIVKTVENADDVSDDDIQAQIIPVKKPRPPKSALQMASVEKMIAAKKRNAEIRAIARGMEELENKKILEEKVVKKAIAIKKKQIKKEKIIEEISDDDEPIENIRKMASKQRVVEKIVYVENKPRFTFV